MITFTISEASAIQGLRVYRDILAGRGCGCVQSGKASETCRTAWIAAHRDVTAIVEGHPELQAELRAVAAQVVSLAPVRPALAPTD